MLKQHKKHCNSKIRKQQEVKKFNVLKIRTSVFVVKEFRDVGISNSTDEFE